MEIHSMLRPERILMDLKAGSKREALIEIVQEMGKNPGITDT